MPTTHVVEIRQYAYHPDSLTIQVGDKVKWINRDSVAHTATRNQAPAFDTGPISNGQESRQIEFSVASGANGFGYSCTPHPAMTAKIIVA